ncbi:MAG TPA: signal peptidase II [Bryobacteraceae bacterium]|jgi:signal peptidase II|nr:signal peptidase II [Bryobacteraceae bacterium]
MDSAIVDLRLKAYGTGAAVLVLDRLTKWLIETNVSFFDSLKVIPGFFDIVRSENSGVAFGLFNDSTSQWRTLSLVLLSLAAVLGIAVLLWRPERLDRLSRWGFSLILGGAAGNVVDRILYGKVTDFLLLYVRDYQWPAFNIADSAIVLGSVLLALGLLRPKPQAANVP